MLRIQSADISAAFSDYRKAIADKVLTRSQLDRARVLFDKGATAKKDLEVAEDTYDKAVVDVETAAERLRVHGIDPERPPAGVVDIVAPASGVITEQNITNAAGVKSLEVEFEYLAPIRREEGFISRVSSSRSQVPMESTWTSSTTRKSKPNSLFSLITMERR